MGRWRSSMKYQASLSDLSHERERGIKRGKKVNFRVLLSPLSLHAFSKWVPEIKIKAPRTLCRNDSRTQNDVEVLGGKAFSGILLGVLTLIIIFGSPGSPPQFCCCHGNQPRPHKLPLMMLAARPLISNSVCHLFIFPWCQPCLHIRAAAFEDPIALRCTKHNFKVTRPVLLCTVGSRNWPEGICVRLLHVWSKCVLKVGEVTNFD